ncbi:MAG: hypothetical protein ACLVAW_02175 [Eisenbergiella massiliensis]
MNENILLAGLTCLADPKARSISPEFPWGRERRHGCGRNGKGVRKRVDRAGRFPFR